MTDFKKIKLKNNESHTKSPTHQKAYAHTSHIIHKNAKITHIPINRSSRGKK